MKISADPVVSVIIPVWQDHDALAELLRTLPSHGNAETIVVATRDEALRYRDLQDQFESVHWVTAPRGRGGQMDAGAAVAHGRWLLFLHADSRLPADWLDVVIEADRRPGIVGGAFRFALDSRDWRARVIELGVRVRVAVFRLPYGDQALFARRSAFNIVGGFRGLPLMEDVDLVRRLKRYGRLHFDRAAVTTSARRWERDGWVRRSFGNLLLIAKYLAGVNPALLARRYHGRKPEAIVMMARAPWTPGKTRLHAFDEMAHADLRRALFEDTLDVIRSISATDQIIACEPADEVRAMRQIVGSSCEVVSQRGTSLGDRLAHAFDDAFRRGYRSVILIGSDLPDLPDRRLRAALASLADGSDRVVIGPALDGGYYLVGLNRPHPQLFHGSDWGTGHVLCQTLERAAELGLPISRLEEWNDVDDLGDLERFAQAGLSAPRTREWARRHLRAASVQPEHTCQQG
ncbi:MAG: TIGR04283 family arsenosugar biosynthesis glycosyltransferase [Acidobacteria bacterium]|nr:TIGR04283 family arsenosugar biosynthesis glycosyltransferase [Acidobacteriota bacterium]